MQPKFDVQLLSEALDFVNRLDQKTKAKVFFNIKKAQLINDSELFKKLTDNIWEFRTLYAGAAIRLFAFWDRDEKALVVATHGILKKTQKTPKNEIEHAEQIRKKYFDEKK